MNEEKNYKIIFSDLDETLLVNQQVPDFNIESIKKCREKGTKFEVATGRSTELIQEILKHFWILHFLIPFLIYLYSQKVQIFFHKHFRFLVILVIHFDKNHV